MHLRAVGGKATLTTSAAIPELVRAAMPGRSLSDVFGHAALSGRGYRIGRVVDVDPDRAIGDPAWRVHFPAPMVEWRPPWARRVSA